MNNMRHYISIFTFFLALLSIGGSVLAQSPWDQTNVNPHHNWTIKFNLEVDDKTINKENIYVKRGSSVVESVTVAAVNKTTAIVKAPTNGYKEGETYTLYVENTVKSAKGTPLNDRIKMTFTIANHSKVSSYEYEVYQLVNKERERLGRKPLQLSEELSLVAREKSKDMIVHNYFAHNSPKYGSPFDMMKAFNIHYRAAGENIAAGQITPQDVMTSWMNSPGHRANILDSRFTHIGVGLANGGSYGTYWTQMFISK